jgi:hypothetical protein
MPASGFPTRPGSRVLLLTVILPVWVERPFLVRGMTILTPPSLLLLSTGLLVTPDRIPHMEKFIEKSFCFQCGEIIDSRLILSHKCVYCSVWEEFPLTRLEVNHVPAENPDYSRESKNVGDEPTVLPTEESSQG